MRSVRSARQRALMVAALRTARHAPGRPAPLLARISAALRMIIAPLSEAGPLIGGGNLAFKGATVDRLTGADWSYSILDADNELRGNVRRLRARARDLYRNDGYIRRWVRLYLLNVLGPGVGLRPRVRNNDETLATVLNKRIRAGWGDYGKRVSLDGRWGRTQFERIMLRHYAREGEALCRFWRGREYNAHGLALELVDPDVLDETINHESYGAENAVRMGVEQDALGRPVAYLLRKGYGLGYARGDVERVPADQLYHYFDPDRCNQTRGITPLAPVLWPTRMMGGVEEAELVATRLAASKMGFFTQEQDNADDEVPPDEETGTLEMEATPGALEVLPAGYKFESWNPDHPNPQLFEFQAMALRKIASALGVSYPSLSADLRQVNYTSLKAGLMMERDQWRDEQALLVAFESRLYDEWLNAAQLTGVLQLDMRDPARFREATYHTRGWDWIEPLREIQATRLAIQTGLASRTAVLAEQGRDFDDVLEELEEELEAAEEAGIDVVNGDAVGDAAKAPDGAPDGEADEESMQMGKEVDDAAGARFVAVAEDLAHRIERLRRRRPEPARNGSGH